MNLLVTSFLLSLLHLSLAQTENFVVEVVEYNPLQEADFKVRCLATVIHSRFLLTTAFCVNDPTTGSSELGIAQGMFVSDNINGTVAKIVAIKKAYIHEEYDAAKNRFANIAVLEVSLR